MSHPGYPRTGAPEGLAQPREPALEAVPAWDLRDLYASIDDPAISADLDRADAGAREFEQSFQGRVDALSGAELAGAIAAYERIEERLGRVLSYAQLVFAADSTAPETGQFYQTMMERATDTGTHLLFFALEINRIEDAALEQRLEDAALARFAPWLRDLRVFRPHQLSDELE
ncbi:MAG TPA: oligoendopeptidase F, partial [Acetobacteraceae bacterium]|nr:oligoendopeptidase F [Acetobacteraceae bacterium]